MTARELVAASGITKSFGGTKALDKVDFEVLSGEVQALLGENGAGKTTLMNVLSGLYKPESGEILIEGKPMRADSPKQALAMGIDCVHQHFQLIENFTVFENIVLGGQIVGDKTERISESDIRSLSNEHNLVVNLDAKVKELQMGQRQRVEIIKALVRRPKVLLLDEPTTNLVPQEVDLFLETMKGLARKGIGIVFITHKIKEAASVATRVTVMKRGKNVGSYSISDVTEKSLVELMMGATQGANTLSPAEYSTGTGKKQSPLLEVSGVTLNDKKEGALLKSVSFQLYPGEILGVAGVTGNGQRPLVEALARVRKQSEGSIKIGGVEVSKMDASHVMGLGLSYIPEDRMHDGVLSRMTVAENLLLGHHGEKPYCKGTIINGNEVGEMASEMVTRYNIKTQGIKTNAATLSGGNIQKLLIARALLSSPRILVAHNPTRGLDVSTTNFFLNKMLSLRSAGTGILFVSEDLDELLSVCDRITVLFKGELQGTLARSEFDRYKIGSMMLASRASANEANG